MKPLIEPLVVGNWKMNPQSVSLAERLARETAALCGKISNVTVVLAPPSVYMGAVSRAMKTRQCALGAQNVHHEKLGAFTGEVSLSMLESLGVTHVIIGHSERRRSGESDEAVNAKVLATLKAGLTPIVCIGEETRDVSGHYFSFIESQIRKALRGISRAKLESVVIAYEPVWAIGSGTPATPGDMHEMKLFISKVLADLFGRPYGEKVRVLYGGSVTAKNAPLLMEEGMIEGFLVGGASLNAEEFALIAKAAALHASP